MNTPQQIIPVRLVKVAHEAEAGVIISTLSNHGIEAHSTGDFTSGLRAETPGMIQIWVHQENLGMARSVLATIKEDSKEIDWSTVETGDTSEVTPEETRSEANTDE